MLPMASGVLSFPVTFGRAADPLAKVSLARRFPGFYNRSEQAHVPGFGWEAQALRSILQFMVACTSAGESTMGKSE